MNIQDETVVVSFFVNTKRKCNKEHIEKHILLLSQIKTNVRQCGVKTTATACKKKAY